MNPLADYFNGFSEFLRTGSNELIVDFLDGERNSDFMSIYRNGFFKSCQSALKANFPSVVNLLGEEYFTQIARSYITHYPPKKSTLIGYGEDEFVGFLSETVVDLPYLRDFALLDLYWLTSLNSNESPVWSSELVTQMASQEVDLSQVPVSLVESAHLITTAFSVLSTWAVLKRGDALEEHIKLIPEEQSILIWRCAGEVRVRVLDKLDLVLLQSLKKGVTLENATLSALEIEANFDISEYFSELLQNRLLTLLY